MKFRFLWPTTLCLFFAAGVQAATRVALMDITTDDNSYRSEVAAEAVSASLQAKMTDLADVEWVERSQLQLAAHELSLFSGGHVSQSDALRLGKFLKADLLITGHFADVPAKGRVASFEVIDLEHADVLADCQVDLNVRTNEAIRITSEALSASAKALGDALRTAQARRKETAAQNTIAPLFFANIGKSHRLDFLEADLMRAFQDSASSVSNVHVLQFPRAREATPESELVIGGLVEADLDAWQHVADVYVWGSYAEQDASNVAFDKTAVDVTWHVWDGQHEPQEFSNTVTVAELRQLTSKVAQSGIAAARARSRARNPQVRGHVAELLFKQATDVKKEFEDLPSLYAAPQGEGMWKYEVKMLCLARFFEPQNRQIQKLALIERWKLAEPLPNIKIPRWFRFDIWAREQKAADSAGFVDKFGLDAEKPTDAAVAIEYIRSRTEPMGELKRLEKEDMDWTSEWPEDVRADWHQRMDKDLLHRIQVADKAFLKTSDDQRRDEWRHMDEYHWGNFYYDVWNGAWPVVRSQEVTTAIIDELWSANHYGANLFLADRFRWAYVGEDRPEDGQKILDELYHTEWVKDHPPKPKVQSAARNAKPAIRHPAPGLPPHPLDLLPPTLRPSMRQIEIGQNPNGDGVMCLCPIGDKLWISTQAVDNDREANSALNGSPGNPAWPLPIFPLLVEPTRARLLVYAPSTGSQTDITERIGAHSKITSICEYDHQLWLTSQANGVSTVDPQTLQVRHFGSRDGLGTEQLYTCAIVPPHLYLGGGPAQPAAAYDRPAPKPISGQLCAWDAASSRWSTETAGPSLRQITGLSASKQYLLVGSQTYDGLPLRISDFHLQLFDTQQRSWRDVTETTMINNGQPGLVEWDMTTATSDEKGFWIGSSGGLVSLNPRDGATRQWRSKKSDREVRPTTRLRGGITALAQDGDYLWIATSVGWSGLLYHNHGYPANYMSGDMRKYVFLLHKLSGQWVGQFEVPNQVTAMAVSGDRLWIGFGRDENNKALLEVEKRPLLNIPAAKWVTDDIPDQEYHDAIARLTPVEQAHYYMLLHDYEKVLGILKGPLNGADEAEIADAEKMKASCMEKLHPGTSTQTAATASTNSAESILDAIQRNDLPAVESLIPTAAKTNVQHALCVACQWGKIEAVKLLLAKGGDPNVLSQDFSPLMAAASSGRLEITQILLQHGASLEARNSFGDTALQIAAIGGHPKLIKLLLDKGADVNTRNHDGRTPLMCDAYWGGSVHSAELLLAHGARLNDVDHEGKTALQIAQKNDCLKLIAFLKQASQQSGGQQASKNEP